MTWKPPEPRKVTPRDVVDAFTRFTDRDDQIAQLAARCDALEELCTALVAQLPTSSQLAIITGRCGRPVTWEGYSEVELTE